MGEITRVRIVGKAAGSGAGIAMPWLLLRVEDADTGRLLPVSPHRPIVLRESGDAVIADLSVIVYAVDLTSDESMIGRCVEMIPADAAKGVETINGIVVCRCHHQSANDHVHDRPAIDNSISRDVDSTQAEGRCKPV